MELSGRLASFPIAELLTWAANDRRTGSLVVRRSSREKRIYFEQGRIVACLSDSTTEFYGQHLLLEGYLERKTLVRSLVLCKEKGRRLGAILVDEGILERSAVERTLSELIEDLVCDVFLWDRGIFFFQSDPAPEEEILARPINTLSLVLEGTRWIDEIQRIRRLLKHDHLFLRPSDGEVPHRVHPRAAVLLGQLREMMTIEDLYRATGGSYYRFLAAAYELVRKGILEVVDRGMEGPVSTRELPLSNLLLEQAAEEQLSVALRDAAIPLHLLELYTPVRVREPSTDEWEELSEKEREFLGRVDGRRSLREILSRDREARNSEVEMLLVQIGKGRFAFVPPSSEES